MEFFNFLISIIAVVLCGISLIITFASMSIPCNYRIFMRGWATLSFGLIMVGLVMFEEGDLFMRLGSVSLMSYRVAIYYMNRSLVNV